MPASKVLKIVTGILEACLAIPILGGIVVISLLYTPLFVMLALHIVALVMSKKEGTSGTGSILGIVTSFVAWIPFVGWVMHLITAILLLVDASKKEVHN